MQFIRLETYLFMDINQMKSLQGPHIKHKIYIVQNFFFKDGFYKEL